MKIFPFFIFFLSSLWLLDKMVVDKKDVLRDPDCVEESDVNSKEIMLLLVSPVYNAGEIQISRKIKKLKNSIDILLFDILQISFRRSNFFLRLQNFSCFLLPNFFNL